MSFVNSLKNALEIVKLNKKVIIDVSRDPSSLVRGIAILAIAGIISGVAARNFASIVVSPIIMVLFSFLWVGILHFIAKFFKGEANFNEFYGVLAHSTILNWLAILYTIPTLGAVLSVLVSIWSLVVGVVIVENIYGLDRVKSIIVVLSPIILIFVLLFIGGAGSLYNVFEPAAFLP